jgi:flagellum-specific ATP synthase
MAAEAEAKDLIEIGAYVPGTNRVVDRAVALRDPIRAFLCQEVEDRWEAERSFDRLGVMLRSAA